MRIGNNIHMRQIYKRQIVPLLSVAVAVMLPACSPKNKVEAWKPRPIVDWNNISAQPVERLYDEYRIVVPLPTQGLFPANIAVTRVAIGVIDDALQAVGPMIHKDPRNEFLQWNSAFDNQMAVSEVFPIDQFDMGGGIAEPSQIVAAFKALDARLGLLYAMNELSSSETEMLGTLYDTQTAQPIAYIHAQAVSIVSPEDKKQKKPVDLWETDSKALVRRKFERMVYGCIYELITQDQPAAIETPVGWTPVLPVRPMEWPPRADRRRW